MVIFVCCVQASIKTFDHIRAKSGNYVQDGGITSWLQAQSDCVAEKINIILRDINMGITMKRCVMSVFPTGLVATKDFDQFRNSHSQASCEKLKSAKRQPMKGTQKSKPTHLVLFKENLQCMQKT